MPVGHARDREGARSRRPARDARADDPRERLSPAPAARRRARAAHGRPAPLHGVGRPDPHRLGRIPGVLARVAQQRHGGRRRVQVAHRRIAADVHARERDADRDQPRRRRDHAVRSRDSRAERARRGEGRQRAQPALARAVPRRSSTGCTRTDGAPKQTLFPIVQGGVHADLRRAAATQSRRRAVGRHSRSAGSAWGKKSPRCTRCSKCATTRSRATARAT